MKKTLVFLMTIGLVALLVGAGFAAYFSDTETSTGNTLSAGTLDLKVDGGDSPVVHIDEGDLKPGDSLCYKWELKNTGSIDGDPSIEFSAIDNQDNGTNEPEDEAEAEAYASAGGELGQYLKTCTGYAPCGWSGCTISKHLYCNWQTGPAHSWGTPGLNGLGGETLTGLPTLGQDETTCFILTMQLEDDLRAHSGTGWYDVNDNIIQSDSVEFDITFELVQSD